MAALGYSLNNISLFGLVLAIGIVVDDAIVVLENTERQMAKGFDPRTATLTAMEEITEPIIAITPSSWVARRMNILWGVQPFVLREVGEYHEQIVERVDEYLLSRDIVVPGDRLVMMMGSPIYQRAKTNLLRVHRVVAHV